MNHLIHEKSPYLLQHTQNPVDWYPWGNEAFEQAKKEDRPVFLSIGYSTCHWCHVMAHESFENEEVAELLNQKYIAIKVDREERPDIDAVYMSVCQAVTGSGGWPLTVIMTPEQHPFFAGTYFPKKSRYGRPGLMEILQEIEKMWRQRRGELIAAGARITEAICREETNLDPDLEGAMGWNLNQRKNSLPRPELAMIHRAAELLRQNFDKHYGGFGNAPKFPVPHNLFFLMRYAMAEDKTDYIPIVEQTLRSMADGGIFDHIGGGFSRYSTDERWLVPHFEKMLYDNALLAIAYLECYQLTKDHYYAEIAEKTLDYILEEQTGAEGEFFCGQDADSDGVEGKYYFFTPEEILHVLGEKAGREFCAAYDITEVGNFEGKSIPNRIGKEMPLPEGIEELKETLYQYRKKRTSLHLDDKVILSWNAWTIFAMAKAAQILGEDKYKRAAERAHCFIKKYMTDAKDRLFLRWRDGQAAHAGTLDDYAVYGLALLELYQATFQTKYLGEALLRAEQLCEFFADERNGGYYMTASDAEQLIKRPKETYDGAIPSGNSAAAVLLGRLARYTGEQRWQEASARQNYFLARAMGEIPYGNSLGLIALMEALYPSKELVCVTSEHFVETEPLGQLKTYIAQNLNLNLSVLCKTKENAAALAVIAPFTADYPVPEQDSTYYLCTNGACGMPCKKFEELDL